MSVEQSQSSASQSQLNDVLRKKALIDVQLNDLARADAKLGLPSRPWRIRADAVNNTVNSAEKSPSTDIVAGVREEGELGPQSKASSRTRTTVVETDATSVVRNKRLFGSLLLGTLRGAKEDISNVSDAAKRRAELESKVSESLANERSQSVETQRRKLRHEAQVLANEVAAIERASFATLIAAHEARLTPFRKTVTLPHIYWCTRDEHEQFRIDERARREANAESGEEFGSNANDAPGNTTDVANAAAAQSTTAAAANVAGKRKQRSDDGGDGDGARVDERNEKNESNDEERATAKVARRPTDADADEDDLETDGAEALAVTFD